MTSKRIPGLADVCERAAEAFRAFWRALRGYSIRRSVWVQRGTVVNLENGDIAMHPLDAISVECEGDPLTELDEALGWIVERAHLELDQLLVQTDYRIRLAEQRQDARLDAWLTANGMTVYDLRAARTRSRWILRDTGPITAANIAGATITVERIVPRVGAL